MIEWALIYLIEYTKGFPIGMAGTSSLSLEAKIYEQRTGGQ